MFRFSRSGWLRSAAGVRSSPLPPPTTRRPSESSCRCALHTTTHLHGRTLPYPIGGDVVDRGSSPSPSSSSTLRPGLAAAARLAALFANMPIQTHIETNVRSTQADTQTHSSPSSSSSASSSSSGSPSSPPPPPSGRQQAAAAIAAVTTSHITPQFVVFIRTDSDIDRPGVPITADMILSHSAKEGLDWSGMGGLSARHIHVLHAPDGMSYSRMAGFPCHTAFYITFPRHETRSPARFNFVEQMLLVDDQPTTQYARQVQHWGWKLIRYPNQIQISTSAGRSTNERALTPRSVLLSARDAGLPGWDVIEEHMIQGGKSSLWMRYSGGRAPVQFTIRVPPHPRYLAAVADIARTSAQLRKKLGWVADVPRTTNGMQQEVPALQVPQIPRIKNAQAKTQTAVAKDSTPAATTPVQEVTQSVPSTPAAVTPTPPPAATKVPSRFYFYLVDESGRLQIEDEVVNSRSLGLRDRRALNLMYSQLRVSSEATNLQAHLELNVPVPNASPLAPIAQGPHATIKGQLPMSTIIHTYPFVSLCAGELNFLRCALVPIVFKALIADTSSRAHANGHSHLLQYGGDLTHPFDPRQLSVDPVGRLFHPSPMIGTSQNANLGLLSSHLTQELAIHEARFTRDEIDASIRQQEETRRLTIENHEEYQRRLETAPRELAGCTSDRWIRERVQAQLTQMGLHLQLSRYVIEWQGKTYRIRSIDDVALKATNTK